MQDQSYPISDARIVAQARPPLENSHPKGAVMLAVALTLGLAAGVGLAILREALDGTVRTPAQLRGATGLPVLGVVPRTRLLGRRAWRLARGTAPRVDRLVLPPALRAALSARGGAMADAAHAVRAAAARQSAQGPEVRVIGCVAARAGEGTSTFAANLAAHVAARGQRAVLVDWNPRDRALSRALSPDGARPGLADLARGEATLDQVALADPETGLRFLPLSEAGPPAGPVAARALLGALRRETDLVVVDLPPLAEDNTALALCDLLDGFVLVARWGATPQALLGEAVGRAAPLDALFLGAVLNGAEIRRMRLYPQDPLRPVARRQAAYAA